MTTPAENSESLPPFDVRNVRRSKQNPMPMYYQLRRALERLMLMGEFPEGSQLPTEAELCARFSVSRITVRRAMEQLCEEGVVERTRGRGSFVRRLPGREEGEDVVPGVFRPVEIGIDGVLGSYVDGPEQDNWGSRVLRGIEEVLLAEGCHLTFLPPLEGGEEARYIARLEELKGRLGGVLSLAATRFGMIREELEARSLPWVTVNLTSRLQSVNFVTADNFRGGYELGRLFARLGYGPALVVGPGLNVAISSADKFFGFLQGCMEGGMRTHEVDYLQTDKGGRRGDEWWMRELGGRLRAPGRPRALFCLGDFLAASALRVCHEEGLEVPGDVAVVGATGLALADHMTPPLTVLAQPMEELGREAATMLLEMIATRRMSLPGRFVPGPFVVRPSCPGG